MVIGCDIVVVDGGIMLVDGGSWLEMLVDGGGMW